jgi:chromosome partitioning protein
MKVQIPFASDVERMGVHRAPVMATVPKSAAGKAFHALYEEMIKRVADE